MARIPCALSATMRKYNNNANIMLVTEDLYIKTQNAVLF